MAEKQTNKPAAKQTQKPAGNKAADKKEAPQKPNEPKDTGPKLADIASAYLKKKEAFDLTHTTLTKRIDGNRANLERIQSMLTKAELQLSQLSAPSVKLDLVNPLAKELLKSLPGYDAYEVLGPIGTVEAITITFFGEENEGEEHAPDKSITIATKMEKGGLGVRDYSVDTKLHPPGSIGYNSGLNHPIKEVPSDATIEFLVGWIK